MDENHAMIIYCFGKDYQWYEIHTFFGMLSVKSEIIPIWLNFIPWSTIYWR